MSTRRARPVMLIVFAALTGLAGVAYAAQQDVAEQAPSVPRERAAEAAQPGDDSLIAWPCLDRPGCSAGEGEAQATTAASVRTASAEAEPTAIPLPAALGMMGLGMTALGLFMRRRRDA